MMAPSRLHWARCSGSALALFVSAALLAGSCETPKNRADRVTSAANVSRSIHGKPSDSRVQRCDNARVPCVTSPYVGSPLFQRISSVPEAVFHPAPGVRVTQVTSSSWGNSLSYYDIPFLAGGGERAGVGVKSVEARLIYNSVDDSGAWNVVSARLDGTDAILLISRVPPSFSTTRVDLSHDGRVLTYLRMNDEPTTEGGQKRGAWDVYACRLAPDGRSCSENRVTWQNFPVADKLKTSPAVVHRNKHLLAFSHENQLFLVHDDGTKVDGITRGVEDLTEIVKPLSHGATFHRLRLNPRFPSILYFKLNDTGAEDEEENNTGLGHVKRMTSLYVMDWTRRETIAWYRSPQPATHTVWLPKGRTIAASLAGVWTEFEILDAQGRIHRDLGNGVPANAKHLDAFGSRDEGCEKNPNGASFYGAYSSDEKWLVVATNPVQGCGSDAGGRLYLVERASGKARFLTETRSFGPLPPGQARLGFLVDSGKLALVFSSDRGKDPSLLGHTPAHKKEVQPAQIYRVDLDERID